jgi:hypothetical protein
VWRVKNCIPPIISHASGATKSYSDINMHHAWPLVGNHFQNIDSKPSLPYVSDVGAFGVWTYRAFGVSTSNKIYQHVVFFSRSKSVVQISRITRHLGYQIR